MATNFNLGNPYSFPSLSNVANQNTFRQRNPNVKTARQLAEERQAEEAARQALILNSAGGFAPINTNNFRGSTEPSAFANAVRGIEFKPNAVALGNKIASLYDRRTPEEIAAENAAVMNNNNVTSGGGGGLISSANAAEYVPTPFDPSTTNDLLPDYLRVDNSMPLSAKDMILQGAASAASNIEQTPKTRRGFMQRLGDKIMQDDPNQIGLSETLRRVGGAMVGASGQGGLAAYQAASDAYGGIQDENRKLAQAEQARLDAINEAELDRLATQQAAAAELIQETAPLIQDAQAQQTEFSDLINIISGNDPEFGDINAVGMTKGSETAQSIGEMFGTKGAIVRKRLQKLVIDSTLTKTARTKGAVSDREMALFQSDIPSMYADESVWIDWLNRGLKLHQEAERNLRNNVFPYANENSMPSDAPLAGFSKEDADVLSQYIMD